MERVAALKKRHELEAQQEQLKRMKEQLELETELAATTEKTKCIRGHGIKEQL